MPAVSYVLVKVLSPKIIRLTALIFGQSPYNGAKGLVRPGATCSLKVLVETALADKSSDRSRFLKMGF